MENLKILYEDNHIVVVEKKPNIPSQADKTEDIDLLTSVKNYIKEKYNKPGNVYLGLVHRLDRPVGGIMIFAKTSLPFKIAQAVSSQLDSSAIISEFSSIVTGLLLNNVFLVLFILIL